MNALKISRVSVFLLACCLSPISFAATHPKMEIYAGTGVGGSAGDNGPADQAELNGPTGIAQAADGSLYICDTPNHRIRRVPWARIITPLARTRERR